jgi:nicotinic acid mononucleotide adenylyltransferase
MATAAMEVVSLEEIVFMPCFVSPFKESTMASAGQRHHMLNLAIEDEALNHVSVSDLEIRREGPSYSWHWIIGSDQWDSIEKWANPAFLRDQLHFLVLKRQGQNVQEREGWEFTAVPFNHPASSTEIRADFSSHLEWVTPAVASFCEESGLYGA